MDKDFRQLLRRLSQNWFKSEHFEWL